MSKATDDLKKLSGLPPEVFAKSTDQIRVRTERFRQLYANNMQVGFSSWDLAITFGEITGEQDGKPVIEETVRVIMTREIAKVLSTILKNHIDVYEQHVGELKLPVIETTETPATEAEGEGEPALEAATDTKQKPVV